MEFNKTVHCSDENGDPVRNEDGSIRLKPNWKAVAVDHKGRKFNASIHGKEPELGADGFLKMKRRDSARSPMGATSRTRDFVDKFREEGYEYRLVNDDGGRIESFEKHDWEPVMAGSEKATMKVGQARAPGTTAVLMRKPKEWYDEDQERKNRLLNVNLENKTKPKSEEGQYEAEHDKGKGFYQATPLR